MKRNVLVLGLALLLAAVGTTAVLRYVSQADARALAGKQAVAVLVAAEPIPSGTTARSAEADGLFRVEQMPADAVPTDALGEIAPEMAPLVAAADIQPGQLVLRSMFSAEQPTESELAIPKGKVAVTIALGVPQQVAGYVRPGSSIAVFDTYTDNGRRQPTGDGLPLQRDDVQITRVLVPKIEVLAIGAAPAAAQEGAAPTSTGGEQAGASVLVTVAADQTDAERLILRAQTGSLHLALLSSGSRIAPKGSTDTRSLYRHGK